MIIMKLSDLREVSENVNLDEYLELYKYVRDNMEHKELLKNSETYRKLYENENTLNSEETSF